MSKSDAQVGIQQLMQAEQEAQNIVAKARQAHQSPLAEKTAMMKRATEEAAKEIAQYRAQREAQFQEYCSKHAGSKDEYASKLNAETERQIAEITKAAATKGEEVIRMLLDSVTEVYTEVTTTSSGDKILA